MSARSFVPIDRNAMRDGNPCGLENDLGEVLLRRQRRGEHAGVRIGNAKNLEDALNRSVFPDASVQRVESDVGPQLCEGVGDRAVDVDAGDAVALGFERVGAAAAGVQRNRTLRRPAAHQDRDMLHSPRQFANNPPTGRVKAGLSGAS